MGDNRILVNLFPLASPPRPPPPPAPPSPSWLCYARKWNFSRHFPPKVPLQNGERDNRQRWVNLEDLHAFSVISGFAGTRCWIRIDLLFFQAPTAQLSSASHSCNPAYVCLIIL